MSAHPKAEACAEKLLRQGVWRAVMDRDGHRRTYYYNAATKERVWDLVSHVVKHKLHEVEDASQQSSAPRLSSEQGEGEAVQPMGCNSAAMVDTSPSSTTSKPLATGDGASPTPKQRGDPRAAPLSAARESQQKTSFTTAVPPITHCKRRNVVRELSQIWKPVHHQEALAILSWLSLYCRGPRDLLMPGGIAQVTPQLSYVVIAAFPLSPRGTPTPPPTGCYHVVFESAVVSSSSSSHCTARFSPLESPSNSTTAAWTVSSTYLIHLECSGTDGAAVTSSASVCWALMREDSRDVPVLHPQAVISLLTPTSLGVPWPLCGWAEDKNSETISDEMRHAFEGHLPSRPQCSSSAPHCVVVTMSSCTSASADMMKQCCLSIAQKHASVLSSANVPRTAGGRTDGGPENVNTANVRARRHVNCNSVGGGRVASSKKASYLGSLLDEALHSPKAICASYSAAVMHLSHHSTSPPPSVNDRRLSRPLSRSRTPATSRASTTAVLFPATPSSQRQNVLRQNPRPQHNPQSEDLFHSIMDQLDTVSGILGCS